MTNQRNLDRISEAVAPYTRSRVILSEYEISRAARSILGHMEYKKCPLFNLKVSEEVRLRRYIEGQPNIHLVTEDIGLPEDVDGVVIKKPLEECHRNIYLLAVSPYVKESFLRTFTMAHELGHIFLHGKLLEANLMTPRRSLRWYQPSNRLRHLMEAEANIFSLYLLIPLSLLEVVYGALPDQEKKNYAYYVRDVLEEIFHSKIDICLIMARLYLYELTKKSGKLCNREIGNLQLDRVCKRGYSWLVTGSDSDLTECEKHCESVEVDDRLVNDTIDALVNRNILPAL